MKTRKWIIAASLLAVTAVGVTQIGQIIKVVGVGAAVKQFGPQINRAFNGLTKHKDTDRAFTKVVPIISIGIDSRKGIGAAQVMGSKAQVDKVEAVAQLDQDILGREVKIRAMVPIDNDGSKGIRAVDGVGVSGIVDLKL
ncbi:MAG: hypothetical protein JST35_09630 [Armatimonadetes bacterium]|nr:hypothetical protein [Armatimonadota bacterium]